MTKNIIEAFNLTKEFDLKAGGKIKALDDVSFKIEDGEIFGLLGPNGAGKTTLISILSTIMQPTHGSAKIFGLDILEYPKKIKNRIGLMLGDEIVYYRLTGYDNLKFFCRIYGIKNYKQKIEEITNILGINHKLKEYVSSYSRGQKLRIALSRVLLIDSDILFLDEPLLGMDPKTSRKIINILLELNKTILLTSHQMHIVRQLCNRIAFLKEGKIIKIDTHSNFIDMLSKFIRVSFQVERESEKELINELNSLDYVNKINQDTNKIFVDITDRKNYPPLLKTLGKYPVYKIKEIEPTLDDVFIELSK